MDVSGLKEPNWQVTWNLETGAAKVPGVYWDGSRLILIGQSRLVLFSQNSAERVVPLPGEGDRFRAFANGKDGDLFFYESAGESASIFYLPRTGTALVKLEPAIPGSHVYSASFYETPDGFGWTAQVSTEMSHFENDRGFREVGYQFSRDSAELTRLSDARDLQTSGRLLGGERIVALDGKTKPLHFESSPDRQTALCPSLGLSFRLSGERPVAAFGTTFSTSARVGYKFTSIERAVYTEIFPSGHCSLRLWQWVP